MKPITIKSFSNVLSEQEMEKVIEILLFKILNLS
jgi:hypothetical protein